MYDELNAMFTQRIASLNDAIRSTFKGGRVRMTFGVKALSPEFKRRILKAVSEFNRFGDGDHDRHEFGQFTIFGQTFCWVIHYYHPTRFSLSIDPSDPSQTLRVLTIMEANEFLANAGVQANG